MNNLLGNNMLMTPLVSLLEIATFSLLLAKAIRLLEGKILLIVSAVLLSVIAIVAAYSGIQAIEYTILGASAAFLLLFILNKMKYLDESDIAISIPLGALLGPLNFTLIFAIAGAVIIIQKITDSEIENAPEYFFGLSDLPPLYDDMEEKSALAAIEAKRLFRTEFSNSSKASSRRTYTADNHKNELMPWALKIMFASTIVIFLGLAR